MIAAEIPRTVRGAGTQRTELAARLPSQIIAWTTSSGGGSDSDVTAVGFRSEHAGKQNRRRPTTAAFWTDNEKGIVRTASPECIT
jgi:hypothetical protein